MLVLLRSDQLRPAVAAAAAAAVLVVAAAAAAAAAVAVRVGSKLTDLCHRPILVERDD